MSTPSVLPNVGAKASLSRQVTDQAIRTFADVTGDRNPVHLDDGFAAGTRFGKRIAHGFLAVSLVSAVLGTRLPGPGTIYLQQLVKFLAPVHVDDVVTAEVEVLEVIPERNRVRLRTTCRNQNGTLLVDGEATVLVERGGQSQ